MEPKSIYSLEIPEIYPKNSNSANYVFFKVKDRDVYHFTFDKNLKYKIIFNYRIPNYFESITIYKLAYFIDVNDYFKNSPGVRKDIIIFQIPKKIKKLFLTCKKRTELDLQDFTIHFNDVVKDLKEIEKVFTPYIFG